jgi:uncharacterized protein (DUF2249 family)
MPKEGKIVELDVRDHLRNRLDPFKLIMDHVKTLGRDDRFLLHATFKPTPLLKVMRLKGFVGKAEKLEADHWLVTFVHKSRKDWLGEADPDADGEAAGDAAGPADGGPEELDGSGDRREPQVHRLDNRGLEPPQPMVRTLRKLEEVRPGDRVIIHNDRVPVFLLDELKTLGYAWEVEEQADGSAIVTITKR